MNDKLYETVKISPKRVFKCLQDNRIESRQNVKKDRQGKYHCPECGGLVEDITDTETGQSFIQVLFL